MNKKNNMVYANANDFLLIKNQAPGYRIKYMLKGININTTTGNGILYW